MSNRIEITLSDERLAALDTARGHEPRASFIKRALDAATTGPARMPATDTEAKLAKLSASVPRGKPASAFTPRPKGKR